MIDFIDLDEMTFSNEVITPDKAQEYLETSVGNRPLNKRRIAEYAKDMAEGKWELNGQTITFDKEGHLHNGHHRLNAVIIANTPVVMSVCRGVERSTFATVDTGVRRNSAQIFAIENINNYAQISAIVLAYSNIKKNQRPYSISKYREPERCLLDTYHSDPSGFQLSFEFSRPLYTKFRAITLSWIAGIHYYLINDLKFNKNTVEYFLQNLCSVNTSTNPAIDHLRTKLIKAKLAHTSIDNSVLYAYIVKCWNVYISNKSNKIITFNPQKEDYPQFVKSTDLMFNS